MKIQNIWLVVLVAFCICCGSFAATTLQDRQQKQPPPKVKRVKRPTFTKKDWDNIFFENLFEQGLVGERPKNLKDSSEGSTTPTGNASTGNQDNGQPQDSGQFAWSKFITSDTVENEIKKLQMQLNKDVTTPGKFKSDYGKVRQSYSILSMMFAIIREYDGEIRWTKDAGAAQASFARAAANARVGTQQAYQSAKRRKDELQDMVRGGGFSGDEKSPDQLEWPTVVDRSPIMIRLNSATQLVKPALANKTEFVGNLDMVLHEAELVAAMAQVLIREDMDEYDEDEYAQFSREMSQAAVDLARAAKAKDYDTAATAYNIIQQSCSNCHEIYQ